MPSHANRCLSLFVPTNRHESLNLFATLNRFYPRFGQGHLSSWVLALDWRFEKPEPYLGLVAEAVDGGIHAEPCEPLGHVQPKVLHHPPAGDRIRVHTLGTWAHSFSCFLLRIAGYKRLSLLDIMIGFWSKFASEPTASGLLQKPTQGRRARCRDSKQ